MTFILDNFITIILSVLGGGFLTILYKYTSNSSSQPQKKSNASKTKYNEKDSLGKIYFVDPKHLIKKEDRAQYKMKRDIKNKIPVMIGELKGKNVAQVSPLTTVVPSEKQIRRHYKVKLSDTQAKNGKDNYVDTRTITKSKSTNKVFLIGSNPLTRSYGRVSQRDYEKYQSARRKRFPNKK